MKSLTSKQQFALDFVSRYIAQNGYGPTVREVRSAMGVTSTNTAAKMLGHLEKRGCITKRYRGVRAIRITEEVQDDARPTL